MPVRCLAARNLLLTRDGQQKVIAPARHASYYRALAQQADRPLRGASWSEWAERLQAEAGNMAAAVRRYDVPCAT